MKESWICSWIWLWQAAALSSRTGRACSCVPRRALRRRRILSIPWPEMTVRLAERGFPVEHVEW